MNFFAFSAAVNGITAIILGSIVLYKKPNSPRTQTFFLFWFSVFFWSFCYFFWQISTNPVSALRWVKGLMFAVILIPVFLYQYTVTLLNKKDEKWLLYGSYAVCFGLASTNFSSLITKGVRQKMDFPYWPDVGPLFHIHLVTFGGLVVYSLYLLIRELPKAKGDRAQQLKYSILATGLGFAGGMTNYFLWYNIPIKPYGNILVSAYTSLIAYTILKYRLMDISVIIRKTLIYSVVIATLTVLYLVTVTVCIKIFEGLAGYQTVFSSALAAGLFTLCFQPLRKRVQGFVDMKFFRQYVDRDEKLYELSREVITHTTPEAMGQALMRVLGESFHPKSAALYLRSRDGSGFTPVAFQGESAPESMAEDNPLSKYFVDHSQPFVQDLPSETGAPQSTRQAPHIARGSKEAA